MARWTTGDYKKFRSGQLDKQIVRAKEIEKIAKRIQREVKKEKKKQRPDNFSLNIKPAFTIKVKPIGAVRLVHSDKWRKRPVAVKYFQYKEELKWKALNYVVKNELYLLFLLPIPESWTKKKKNELVYTKHQQRPDTDNLVKAVKDALMKEDSTVYLECAFKFWGPHGKILFFECFDSWNAAIEEIKSKTYTF